MRVISEIRAAQDVFDRLQLVGQGTPEAASFLARVPVVLDPYMPAGSYMRVYRDVETQQEETEIAHL